MENLPIPSAYLQQPLLNKDPHLNKIFPNLPFLSYYQPPNLKLLFTSASLPNEIFITSTFFCKSPKCHFCPNIIINSTTGPNGVSIKSLEISIVIHLMLSMQFCVISALKNLY